MDVDLSSKMLIIGGTVDNSSIKELIYRFSNVGKIISNNSDRVDTMVREIGMLVLPASSSFPTVVVFIFSTMVHAMTRTTTATSSFKN